MTAARLDEILAALRAVPAPPWHWRGDTNGGPFLCTVRGGWKSVMHFRRIGMQGAQPVFPVDVGQGLAILKDAKECMVPRSDYDTKTFRDIDNPVARWMRDSAQYATELLEELNRRARLAADKTDELLALRQEFEEFRDRCSAHCADRDAEQVAAEDLELKLKTAQAAVDVALLEYTDPEFSGFLASLKAILG
jgi:hypothetical protein